MAEQTATKRRGLSPSPNRIAAAAAPAPAATAEQTAKRARLSLEPNLVMEVGGEIFMVQALIVLQRSTVLRSMLEAGTAGDAQDIHICLPGKSKEEFRTLLPMFLHVDAEIAISRANVKPLLLWAREFDVAYLKLSIDRFLSRDDPAQAVSVSELKLAVEFRLPLRTAQCVKQISEGIHLHAQQLREHADDPEVMGPLWPAIFQSAGTPGASASKMPEQPTAKDLWPLICVAVGGSMAMLNRLAGKRVKIPCKVGSLTGCTIRKVLKDGEVEVIMPDGISQRRAKWSEWTFAS